MILASFVLLLCQPLAAQELTSRGASATEWVNTFRAEQGRGPLRLSNSLQKVAAAHARDMARKGYFGHTGSDGSTVGDRARRAGYDFCFIAENIAKGQGDVQAVLTGWAGSKGHRRNMLSREAKSFALIEAPGRIWVMVLGRDGC